VKHSQVFTIIAAVYIAPHVTPIVGIWAGISFGVWALYHVWRES
jgi:hypothetical protein